jgi:hypothetical protein
MPERDNEKRGALFRNDRKREGREDPDFQGQCKINGQEFWISGWSHAARGEKKGFMSLSFRPKMAREHRGAAENPPEQRRLENQNPFDEEIPF